MLLVCPRFINVLMLFGEFTKFNWILAKAAWSISENIPKNSVGFNKGLIN
jgi:hypothetical protein